MTDIDLQQAITNIQDGSPNTALEVRNILNEFYLRTVKNRQIIIKDVTNQYVTENFDGTGLGIGLEVGYAICNGNNGTRNWDDRIPIAYGVTNTTLGSVKGSNTATLQATNIPPLNIPYTGSSDDTGDNGTFLITSPTESNGAKTLTTSGTNATPFNIENKTIVTLVLMKL